MKLYKKSELKYSRIFFDKKPPKYIFFLTGLIIMTLFVAIISAAYIPKIYIVKAQGDVRVTNTEFLSVVSAGNVITMNKLEGEKVKTGDIILSISSGQEGVQSNALRKQLETLQKKEAIYEKFEQSLEEKNNFMSNSGEEQEYYGKVEYYLSQLNSENYNNNLQYSKIKDEYAKLEKLNQEKLQLINNLEANKTEMEKLEEQLSKKSASNNEHSDAEAEGYRLEMHDTLEMLEMKIKDCKSDIENIQASVTAKESEIEAKRDILKDMERSYHNPTSQAYNTYAQLISELGNVRSVNNKSISELEANLGIAKSQDQTFSISAKNNGILHYTIPLKQGMPVSANQIVAEISDSNKEYYVEAFVLASDISRVHKNASVDMALLGVNSQKYGTLKGKVRQIDSGTINQESKDGNISFYKVIIDLQNLKLEHKQEIIKIKKGMPVEVRIVYDRETYLEWILEMLNFK
ncbi:HlyD family efflux transporter periplasmic adaptor subunit [Enterococcus cecorum]|uniref:HlyD family efflux transporter periplasmic adaptor subunit n=1 Tax=Enterococcus cecorum TaxID=44008 RepID=UPI003F2309A3